MLFDTHAHYDDERFDGDRDALLASMPERGVQPGFTISSTPRSGMDASSASRSPSKRSSS